MSQLKTRMILFSSFPASILLRSGGPSHGALKKEKGKVRLCVPVFLRRSASAPKSVYRGNKCGLQANCATRAVYKTGAQPKSGAYCAHGIFASIIASTGAGIVKFQTALS